MRAASTHNPSTALVGAQILSSLWMLAVGPLAVLLLVVADSGRGRLFAVWSLLTAVLPLVAILARRDRTVRLTRGATVGAGLWLVTLVLVGWLAPSGQTSGRVAHAFATPGRTFARFAPGNLLPECDQLLVGFTLMPMLDPLLTITQAVELKRLTAPIYRELESDADFHALGSVMPDTYRELAGLAPPAEPAEVEFRAAGSAGEPSAATWRSGHSFVYVPAGADRSQPRPVLVFFHGSGGNFKAYLWILSKLADRLGFVLVAPSDGLGNWPTQDCRAALDAALQAASRAAAVDRMRVHIAGLSNGGLAISRLAALRGAQFASMILLSPVFATPEIHSDAFAEQCRGRRMLVVTGDRDDRIPLSYVEENTGRITKAGAQVTLKTFAGADHFLVFSHREQLLPLLEEWFRATPAVIGKN